MKKKLVRAVRGAHSLPRVKEQIVALFEQMKGENGEKRIGYVAGIIGSDGLEKVAENMQKLAEHTERIRREQDFPIFSSTDIFSEELYERLEEMRLEYEEQRKVFMQFWREIFEEGGISDIFMTPRWEESEGAFDEYETAKRLGIAIHYVQTKKEK